MGFGTGGSRISTGGSQSIGSPRPMGISQVLKENMRASAARAINNRLKVCVSLLKIDIEHLLLYQKKKAFIS
jgi:hypothetical protein